MEYHQCNKKAKEAWGQSLVDLSVDITKKIIYLLVFGPIFYLYKNGARGIRGDQLLSMHTEIMNDKITGALILFAIVIAVGLMALLHNTGIRYIHESNADSDAVPQEADPLKVDK